MRRLLVLALAVLTWSCSSPCGCGDDLAPLKLLTDFDSSFRYVGAFSLPGGCSDYVDHASIAEANDGTLFYSDGACIAEVTIPAPVAAATTDQLPRAAIVQPFADYWTPAYADAGKPSNGFTLGGLARIGLKLVVNFYGMYDANNAISKSTFTVPADALLTANYPGADNVWDGAALQGENQGFVGQYVSPIPPYYQRLLGGDTLVGSAACMSIVTRTSYGPAAYAIRAADLGAASEPIHAQPLAYFDQAHWDAEYFGAYEQTKVPKWGPNACAAQGVIIDGSRTALFTGSNGIGKYCYGPGTNDKALAGTPGPDGHVYCYDPYSTNMGPHTYPYRQQYWMVDVRDWTEVRVGRRDPWAVDTYSYGALTLPFSSPTFNGNGGLAFNVKTKTLYLLQMRTEGSDRQRPVVLVYSCTACGAV